MTGYGRTQFDSDEFTISVEIKALNSKFLDLTLRLPRSFAEKEMEVRGMVSGMLERGKVVLNLEYQSKEMPVNSNLINRPLFKSYFINLQNLAEEVNATTDDIFNLAIQFPDVLQAGTQDIVSDEIWQQVKKHITEAMRQCDDFRIQEGNALKNDLRQCMETIKKLLSECEFLVPSRDEAVKERIRTKVTELLNADQIDENRFEQELIYYIEKLDVNEEIVRLKNHLIYFGEVLGGKDAPGKKLGFISQEIGREINTIGSKANDAGMQHLVVGMKEELEKIKEQLLNVI